MHVGRDGYRLCFMRKIPPPSYLQLILCLKWLDNSILNEDYLMMWFEADPEFCICWLKQMGASQRWNLYIYEAGVTCPPIEEQLEIVNSYKNNYGELI